MLRIQRSFSTSAEERSDRRRPRNPGKLNPMPSKIRSQSPEDLGFALAIKDGLRYQAGELAVGDNQMIGMVLVETTGIGNDGSENVEAAGNQGRMGTPCLHGTHEPPGAGHEFDACRRGPQHSIRPARRLTRSRSDSANSISPRMLRAVIGAMASAIPREAASSSSNSAVTMVDSMSNARILLRRPTALCATRSTGARPRAWRASRSTCRGCGYRELHPAEGDGQTGESCHHAPVCLEWSDYCCVG